MQGKDPGEKSSAMPSEGCAGLEGEPGMHGGVAARPSVAVSAPIGHAAAPAAPAATAAPAKPAAPRPASPFVRAENEDDDGYDPYSDRPARIEPLFERDPWS